MRPPEARWSSGRLAALDMDVFRVARTASWYPGHMHLQRRRRQHAPSASSSKAHIQNAHRGRARLSREIEQRAFL